MWLATAWEEEYQHRVMFANEEDAQAWASRWEDDLLDDVKVELVDIMGDDDLPFRVTGVWTDPLKRVGRCKPSHSYYPQRRWVPHTRRTP